MGACAPISVSKDIFIDEDAGLAADKAAPLNALRTTTQNTRSKKKRRDAANFSQQHKRNERRGHVKARKGREKLVSQAGIHVYILL